MSNRKKIIGIWGSFISLLGTLYLAQAAFEYSGQYIESFDGLRRFNVLYLDSILFKISLCIIAFGFIFHLLEKIWEDIPIKFREPMFIGMFLSSILIIFYISLYKFFGIF